MQDKPVALVEAALHHGFYAGRLGHRVDGVLPCANDSLMERSRGEIWR
jgi:hypothetical protein